MMGKGNSPNSRNGLDRGAWLPWAFKLDPLQPVFKVFKLSSHSRLEANTYYQACRLRFKLRDLISCFCCAHTCHTTIDTDSRGSSKTLTVSEVSQPKFEFTGLLITPERGGLKMGQCNFPNLSESQWIVCLDHLNWTICSLLSQFWFPNFQTFVTFMLGGHFLLYQREEGWKWDNRISQPLVFTQGIECLGHLNWTICSQFWSPNVQTFVAFMLGGHFLLSQRERKAENGTM